jgi:hypothetical protein
VKSVAAEGIRRTKTAGVEDFLLNNLGPRARTDTGCEQSVMYSVAQGAVVVLSRESGHVVLSKESGYVGILGILGKGADFGRQVAGYMVLPADMSGFEMKRYDPEPGGCVEFVRRRRIVGSLADLSVIMSIPVIGIN